MIDRKAVMAQLQEFFDEVGWEFQEFSDEVGWESPAEPNEGDAMAASVEKLRTALFAIENYLEGGYFVTDFFGVSPEAEDSKDTRVSTLLAYIDKSKDLMAILTDVVGRERAILAIALLDEVASLAWSFSQEAARFLENTGVPELVKTGVFVEEEEEQLAPLVKRLESIRSELRGVREVEATSVGVPPERWSKPLVHVKWEKEVFKKDESTLRMWRREKNFPMRKCPGGWQVREDKVPDCWRDKLLDD